MFLLLKSIYITTAVIAISLISVTECLSLRKISSSEEKNILEAIKEQRHPQLLGRLPTLINIPLWSEIVSRLLNSSSLSNNEPDYIGNNNDLSSSSEEMTPFPVRVPKATFSMVQRNGMGIKYREGRVKRFACWHSCLGPWRKLNPELRKQKYPIGDSIKGGDGGATVGNDDKTSEENIEITFNSKPITQNKLMESMGKDDDYKDKKEVKRELAFYDDLFTYMGED